MFRCNKLITVLMVLFSSNVAYASIYYNQGGSFETMKVGPSTIIPYGPNQSVGGEPGVGIRNIGNGIKVEFASLTSETASGGADGNGVYTVQSNNLNRNLGVFHFAKITDANVYFGDWAKTELLNDETYQTYYAGKDVTTTLPLSNASYNITGISQYDGSNLLSGTFNVDFQKKKIYGSLANSTRSIDLYSGNIFYSPNNRVTFSISAKEEALTGVAVGAFFGSDASALAGIILFSDTTNDVGFGGTKNEIAEVCVTE